MLADFTKETVSSGGVGSLTLAGAVSGNQTFNDAIGLNIRFPYSIMDGTAWETGRGYLSDATTLVRETFHTSSTGSLLTVTTSAEVHIGLTANTVAEASSCIAAAEMISSHVTELGTATDGSIDANEIHYIPFHLIVSDTFDAFLFNVYTPSAANFKMGLYDVKAGLPHTLLAVHDTDLSVNSPGEIIGTFDGGSLALTSGWYFIGIQCDASGVVLESSPGDSILGNILGGNISAISGVSCTRVTETRTHAAMPNPVDVAGLVLKSNENLAVFGLRQG